MESLVSPDGFLMISLSYKIPIPTQTALAHFVYRQCIVNIHGPIFVTDGETFLNVAQ